MPAMGGFNNQNALLSTLIALQHLMHGLQNNFMCALLQQGIMHQLLWQQLNFLGALQSPNYMSSQQCGLLGRLPMGQNMNQMMGFSPNGLPCSQNPIFPPNSRLPLISSGNSNPGFLGIDNTHVGQSLSSSTGLETQIASQKLQEPILPSQLQDNKSNERQWPQVVIICIIFAAFEGTHLFVITREKMRRRGDFADFRGSSRRNIQCCVDISIGSNGRPIEPLSVGGL
ncbi:hypothetical protein IEQ34_005373 [Dendrobium chrysotoxum]|uniref:Uncharacterized protein n=1 Tax=Dendrobium chrysotoxum TaxID=161865 RepID=A0AAV7GTR4_DENCH|nr:hypothetical protein IEQ34_005373 [Dendrobium chrysotoxum]